MSTKCGERNIMQLGKAIAIIFYHIIKDYDNTITANNLKLITVLKCINCGHSEYPNKN